MSRPSSSYFIRFLFVATPVISTVPIQTTEPISTKVPSKVESLSDLYSLIADKNITDSCTLVKELPADLRTNFELGYASNSLQSGTPETPRLITMKADGSIVIGASGEKCSDSVEVIFFNRAALALGKQKPAANQDVFVFKKVSLDGKAPAVSLTSDAACVKCHQSSTLNAGVASPIWASYAFWSGFYGSLDDRIPQDDATRKTYFGKTLLPGRGSVDKPGDYPADMVTLVKNEKDNYAKWLANRAKEPLYSALEMPPAIAGTIGSFLTGSTVLNFTYEPNARFGFVFSRQNALRLASEIMKSEVMQKIPIASLIYADEGRCQAPDAAMENIAIALKKLRDTKGSQTQKQVDAYEAIYKSSFDKLFADKRYSALVANYLPALLGSMDRWLGFNDGSRANTLELTWNTVLSEAQSNGTIKLPADLAKRLSSFTMKAQYADGKYMSAPDIASIDSIGAAGYAGGYNADSDIETQLCKYLQGLIK